MTARRDQANHRREIDLMNIKTVSVILLLKGTSQAAFTLKSLARGGGGGGGGGVIINGEIKLVKQLKSQNSAIQRNNQTNRPLLVFISPPLLYALYFLVAVL